MCLFHCDSDRTEISLAAGINVEQEVCDTDSAENDRIIMPNMERCETSKDVRFGPELDLDSISQLSDLCCKYDRVLSDIPGQTDVIQCDIKLTTSDPIQSHMLYGTLFRQR